MTDDFEARKRRSFLQVLFKVARLINELAIERVRIATGDERVRTAHTTLFPHLDADGIRLTALAERLGVTKQAVAQLVDELEEMGIVEKVPDPSDGRAKLIRFSDAGNAGLAHGMSILEGLETELANVVGAEHLEHAHETLLRILDSLEDDPSRPR